VKKKKLIKNTSFIVKFESPERRKVEDLRYTAARGREKHYWGKKGGAHKLIKTELQSEATTIAWFRKGCRGE